MQQQLPDVVLEMLQTPKYKGKDVVIDTTPYWSTIRFPFTIAAGLASLVVGSRQAFGYRQGEDMASAGRPGVLAVMADTNLLKSGETRRNADIFVHGVSAYPADGDAALYRRVWRECAVEVSTDGENATPLATLEMIPAGGGLFGNGQSGIKAPDFARAGLVDGGDGATSNYITNGNPINGNCLELGAPVLWTGQQGVDSNFRLNFRTDRQIDEVVGTARVAAAGVQAFTLPASAFVDVRVRLHVWALSLTSVNR